MDEHHEPWTLHAQPGKAGAGRAFVATRTRRIVVSGIPERDARRIIACVNACKGVSTRALEAAAAVTVADDPTLARALRYMASGRFTAVARR